MKAFETTTAKFAPVCLFRINIPPDDVAKVIEAITNVFPVIYGNYDQVVFRSCTGTQQYRSLAGSKTGRSGLVNVAAEQISFTVPDKDEIIADVVEAVTASHPYEEPVILIQKVMASRIKHSKM